MQNIRGKTGNRPICFKVDKSASKLLFLKAGSRQSWQRCSSTEMVWQESVHSFHLLWFIEYWINRWGESAFFNSSNSNLADSNLVPKTPTYFSEKPNHFTPTRELAKGSSEPTTSSYPKSSNAISSVGCLRKRLAEKRISENISDLIISSRRGDTCSTYSSAWNKWVNNCCVEQNVVPVRCDVKWTWSFLPFLSQDVNMEQYVHIGQQFQLCINNNEGRHVGEHPQVNSLITGAFNNRSPQPKYTFIWDDHLVLEYLKKELPNNSDL